MGRDEPLSKPLFTKNPLKSTPKPRPTPEILREAKSSDSIPKGEPNYWGMDRTLWKKK